MRWYEKEANLGIYLSYKEHLNEILKEKPQLLKNLTKCKECNISFISDPRNVKRQDLRCAFGCQEHVRAEKAKTRSKNYYQTEAGKLSKKQQNKKRNKTKKKSLLEMATNTSTLSPVEGVSKSAINYIANITSAIEERKVAREEVVELLNKRVSQHSIGKPPDF